MFGVKQRKYFPAWVTALTRHLQKWVVLRNMRAEPQQPELAELWVALQLLQEKNLSRWIQHLAILRLERMLLEKNWKR